VTAIMIVRPTGRILQNRQQMHAKYKIISERPAGLDMNTGCPTG